MRGFYVPKQPTEGFLILKDRQYLIAMVERLTGSGKYYPTFSVHKYDGARVESLAVAKQVVKKLAKEGEKWQINHFNGLSGDEKEVWRA